MSDLIYSENKLSLANLLINLRAFVFYSFLRLNNVFVFADKFVCTPASATTNQIVVSDSLVSTDLSLLSDTIKNLIQ